MPEDDETAPSVSAELADAGAEPDRSGPRKRGVASEVTTIKITGIVIAALLAVGVVVAALDMKFEADQARWQQRQTCLEWYRLQAEYGLGPWYEKLPQAAADCGGGETDGGTPAVPGGSQPAVNTEEIPDQESTTTSGGSTPTSTTTAPGFPTTTDPSQGP